MADQLNAEAVRAVVSSMIKGREYFDPNSLSLAWELYAAGRIYSNRGLYNEAVAAYAQAAPLYRMYFGENSEVYRDVSRLATLQLGATSTTDSKSQHATPRKRKS